MIRSRKTGVSKYDRIEEYSDREFWKGGIGVMEESKIGVLEEWIAGWIHGRKEK